MFCYKCGKNTGSNFPVCPECLAAESAANEQTAPTNATEPTVEVQQPVQNEQAPQYTKSYVYQPVMATTVAPSRMAGFGRALTSAIMGFVGCIWSFISLGYTTSVFISEQTAGFMFSIMGLPFAIVSLILGIISVKAALTQTNQTKITPIAPMILGITGLSLAALSLLFCLISWLIFSVNMF